MSVRMYLPDSGTPAITPAVSALWNTNPSLVRAPLVRGTAGKTNTALADESSATYVETSGTAGNMIHRQFISEPIPYAQTISGTFKLVVRGAENDTAADCSLQVHIRVLSGDGTTSRGNLYTGHSATLNSTGAALGQEFTATQTTRVFNNVSLASISASAGDRLCVEVGHRYHNTSATSYGTYLTWGDPTGGTDHTFNATETTQLTPWIEFSQNIFQVSTTRAATFDTLATVTPTRTVSFDVLARVTKTRAVTFDVAAPTTTVEVSRDVSFDTLARVTKTRTASFDTLAAVSGPSPAVTFDVLARVTKTRTVTFDVAAPTTTVGVSRDVSFDVLARVTKTRAVTFNVAGQVGVSRTVTFDTLLRIYQVRTVTFDVQEILVSVGVSRVVLFDVDVLPPPAVIPTIFRVPPQIVTSSFVVVVRNQALQRVGAVNVKALSFTPRFRDVGDWSITVSGDDANAPALFQPGAGVLIYHGDNMSTPLMTGPVGSRTRQLTEAGGYEFQVSGPDDMWVLAGRAPYQMPGRTPAAMTDPGGVAHDKITGAAETVVKHYVEANAGQTAGITARRKLTVVPPGGSPHGATVTGKARMLPTLLELIRGLAATGGIGFNVLQTGAALVFDTYVPANRTASIRFSTELRNLVEFSYTETAPTSSYVIAGAGGQLTDRVFVDYLDTAALTKWPGWRFEKYIDQRQTTDSAELTQAMLEELISGGPTTNLAISTRDTAQIRFGRDFFIGDKISVEMPEFNGAKEVIQDVVNEATISWSPDQGPTVVTRVGTSDATGTEPVQKRLRKLAKKTDDVNTVD